MTPPVSNSHPSDDVPSIASLPYEIRYQILSYLLTDSSPIRFNQAHGFHIHKNKELPSYHAQVAAVIPGARQIFYHHNTFQVHDNEIEAFLSDLYCHNLISSINPRRILPRDHIQDVIILMHPHTYHRDYNPALALRGLLSCAKLRSVELRIAALYESLHMFDKTFSEIAEVCVELTDKLGPEGFKASVEWLHGKRNWSVADFRRGKPPGK
ncbi:MAG: hypothetical protein Q9220_007092 [cf. Caloplaca sp. 1 TL-2023]